MLNLFKALFPISTIPKQILKSGKSRNTRPRLAMQERKYLGKTGSGVRFSIFFLSGQERKRTSIYTWGKATV